MKSSRAIYVVENCVKIFIAEKMFDQHQFAMAFNADRQPEQMVTLLHETLDSRMLLYHKVFYQFCRTNFEGGSLGKLF